MARSRGDKRAKWESLASDTRVGVRVNFHGARSRRVMHESANAGKKDRWARSRAAPGNDDDDHDDEDGLASITRFRLDHFVNFDVYACSVVSCGSLRAGTRRTVTRGCENQVIPRVTEMQRDMHIRISDRNGNRTVRMRNRDRLVILGMRAISHPGSRGVSRSSCLAIV